MMKLWLRICWLGCWLILAGLAQTVQAHLTKYTGAEHSATVAEIWIDADRITMQLEIGDRDREAFAGLLRDGVPQPLDVDSGLVLTGDDGRPLAGEVKVVEQRPRTNRSTAPQPTTESTMVMYVEMVYKPEVRPTSLTLTPPRQGSGPEVVAEIGFMVYHESIPVIDFQYLQGPETLRLDWRDPWYSVFDNPDLQRHHRAPLMTFLYIEPYEVRFEILIRLKALASWMSLEVDDPMQIDTEEQVRLREQIGQFFSQYNQVKIDGTPPRPILDRVEFRRVCQSDLAGRAAAGSRRAIDISHRVGWGDLGLRDLWTAA